MAFFVVERGLDSSLSIPLPEGFPTREAAIAALSAAAAAGTVTLAGEVFIADLSAAVPVLVMQAVPSAVPEPVETPREETAAAEVAEPAAELDAESTDEAYTAWEPLEKVPADEPSLADALKRAATSLEDEGIVAPDSIEAEPAVAEPASVLVDDAGGEKSSQWPWANIQAYEISESPDVEESLAGPESAPATEAPVVVADSVEIAEPVVEAADASETDGSTEDDEADAAAPDDVVDVAIPDLAAELSAPGLGLEETAAEEAPIITSAPPEGEDAYLPRPVILGDYADTPAGDRPIADDEAIATETESPEDVPEIAFTDPVLPEADPGYAATGELDLGEYTCDDCVYSNTCPKVGQATPADCGSFQWKSE